MSYCRWSSDGFGCDVYVYEDVSGGFTCHVAAKKITNLQDAPKVGSILNLDEKGRDEWLVRHRAKMDWLENNAIRENIGLPYDNQSFNVDTATEMAERLVELKNMGYQVPDYAIEALFEEGKEAE